ncbi:tRNA (adenosine(37)-N6)-dimethylallyltransferase MiaA [Sphingobacterium sp. SGR-19]|uniref:tRNA (adenosine(37)-N6)-dimethylallyltransferase MiaA n=1 Tax=Sphingobacterium sp. SGR-19 TaxID=2710886 RepID=UPI0013EB1577|nr:tRNA (adenosine(37)-N6)-dimethylallyltransferase MiaA [Sphingobacterium sp. SGR-19]NGM66351.1 tRNA (adenosine(37)-N6)-dimethylallyltransferase MiaA [Sphingobacterium sp. SGR-19]
MTGGKTKRLIVVVGPTAVGKTTMGIALAKHFKTEIISADSRQFYREMSIGTAKPDADELTVVKHHFIDSHTIEEEYSAGDFERGALCLLDSLFEKHDVVVMVGGSGLFVRAVCEGLDNLPKAPVAVRERLNGIFEQEGLESLQQKLKQVDPDYYQHADIHNPQRVIRALEVYEATGQPFSSYRVREMVERPFKIVTIGLNMERQELYDRINLRVDRMIEKGLVSEVRSLLSHRNKPALLTVGYAEIFDFIDGKITLEEAISRIKQNSRRYAKRQITWFKKHGNTVWFEPDDCEGILSFLRSGLTRP